MSSEALFDKIKYFIIDMDGTFYLDGNIIDGSLDFLKKAVSCGKDFCFFTNNSSNNVKVCRERLHNMGCDVADDKIVISSHVTIDFLKKHHSGKKIFLLGNERLTADFINAGIVLDDENPDIVVLGFDTTLTYDKLRRACSLIAGGVRYIATHPDLNCPTSDGFMPDTGSMMALIKASTGRMPDMIMGKPYGHTIDYIAQKLGCNTNELCFIGDRLETDIAIGEHGDVMTVLVLTGVTSREEYEKSDYHADFVAESLGSLSEKL